MSKMIAVLDDESDILELISVNLKKNGFDVITFEEPSKFFNHLSKRIPDLLILDLMMPEMDGFDVCKKIRNTDDWKRIPIIMLTAKGDEMDKILGLELGADDYLTKPFSVRELASRVKAILRRSEPQENQNQILINNILKIDVDKFEVFVNNLKLDLTTTEFRLLKLFAEKPGRVYSRDQILDYLWGNDKIVIDRTVDVHIKNLREKLGEAGLYLKNIRGVGYKFEI